LTVESGVSVVLSHLTMVDGQVADYRWVGGGILSHGTLTVDSCSLRNNSVIGGGDCYGGGVFKEGGVKKNGSTRSANSGHEIGNFYGFAAGGGIANRGTMTVSNCVLTSNSAEAGVEVFRGGGGIFNDGTMAISGCAFSWNIAGGIFSWGYGTVTVSGSTI